MKSNYKKLGSYIREVDIRNAENKKDNLLGVSTQKVFIKSIANTVGTNFKRYKIVKKGQFTYVPDTSRRGDRIGLALLEDYDEALVSNVYTVFEITGHNKLLPEYLMMWFRRPEFDRYARYKSHGSVRELFSWDEMCDVELPVPDIEKQRKIVKDYQAVVNRIKLNEKFNQKLEETAQAIYKQWFIDFEFPISKEYATKMGKPQLEGKPYKSSGGKMVWNDELGKEIPAKWETGAIIDMFELQRGFDLPVQNRIQGDIPIYAANGLSDYHSIAKVKAPAVITGRSGTIGNVFYTSKDCWPLNTTLWVKKFNLAKPILAYFILKNTEIKGFHSGSAVPTLNRNDVHKLSTVKPEISVIEKFELLMGSLFHQMDLLVTEINVLNSLSGILLSKMTKEETTA